MARYCNISYNALDIESPESFVKEFKERQARNHLFVVLASLLTAGCSIFTLISGTMPMIAPFTTSRLIYHANAVRGRTGSMPSKGYSNLIDLIFCNVVVEFGS